MTEHYLYRGKLINPKTNAFRCLENNNPTFWWEFKVGKEYSFRWVNNELKVIGESDTYFDLDFFVYMNGERRTSLKFELVNINPCPYEEVE